MLLMFSGCHQSRRPGCEQQTFEANSNTNPRLVLMLKYPNPGEVKTRLIPALGERRACELYRNMAAYTLGEARRFASTSAATLVAQIAGAPGDEAVRQWLGEGVHFLPQGDGDLGQRLERAARDSLATGASSVVIIGADCPQLTAERLASAIESLADAELVLGPAADGGYYLVGMRKFMPELFHGIRWGSEQVFDQTLGIARKAGISCHLLETLEDLDRPEDLPLWSRSAVARAAGKGRVSVIIPALNEAEHLPRTLEGAQHGHPHEIIVVDGGSADETANVARSMDAIVLRAPRGRAIQMNRGAAVATGEYLLFLHADTVLPSDYERHVSTLLSDPDVAGGAFELSISKSFPGRRFIERTANWRARYRQFPYGDQALFVRRETFAQLGGFPEIPLMEDYEFVRRLRRIGRIAIAPGAAVTSGRRWQRLGWWRTTLINRAIILAYNAGVSPSRLAAWYGGRNEQSRPLASATAGSNHMAGESGPVGWSGH